MGGVNDDEIPALAELARDGAFDVRFIELMPIGECADWDRKRFIPAERVLEVLPKAQRVPSDGVAELWRPEGWRGTVGLIRPLSHRFCADCDRIRITPDGMLKPCLHSAREIPLRGKHGEALVCAIAEGIGGKPKEHHITDGRTSDSLRGMNRIGASRLWDMEVKGSTTKLLYTLQSRHSLFAGKALLGTGEVLLMVTLEMAVSILLGRVQGYTEAFPAGPFVYTGICTLAVDVMLFFSELLLMLIFDNPLPALCVGIVGALIGLFSAFMPPLVSYFVPWGYFVPLSCYEVSYWDQATHTVTYGLRTYSWGLLAFTVVLAAALFAAAWRMMRDKEV